MVSRACIAGLLWAMVATASVGEDTPRLPVPGTDAQKESLNLVKDIFSAEYKARSPEERRALASTMLAQASQTDEAAARFVLLSEARSMAATAGDAKLALRACEELTKQFDLNPLHERTKTLESLATAVKTPEAARVLLNEATATMEKAIKAGDFQAANQSATLAEKAGIKAKDVAALTAIRKRKAEIGTLKNEFEKFTRSEKVLEGNPEDPEANLVTGKYLCFVREAWDSGLPRLAKGSDGGLAALAQASLMNPAEAAEQSVLANQWWEIADSLDGIEGDGARAYAGHWYQKAVGRLSGLSKSLAEKRIAEITSSPTAKQGRQQVNLIELINLNQDVLHGVWKIDKAGLHCTRGGLVPKVRFAFEPPEEYDVSFVFSQPAFRNGLGVILPNRHGGVFCAYLLEDRGVGYGFSVNGQFGKRSPANREYPGAAQPNKKYRALVQVRKNSVKLLVNAKLLASYEGDFSLLKSVSWHDLKDGHQFAVFCDDPTTFESMELLEISGPGKKLR